MARPEFYPLTPLVALLANTAFDGLTRGVVWSPFDVSNNDQTSIFPNS